MLEKCPAVAVLDMGKTRSRVAVFDETATLLDERIRTNPTTRSGVYPNEDVEALWPFVVEALSDFSRVYAINRIIPVAHGAAGALVADDQLVLPLYDYEGHIPAPLDDQYELIRPPFSQTGSPSLPAGLNLGRQLYFLSEHFKEEIKEAKAFLALPQYWAWRLSGIMASEVTSLGCHTDLWNIRKNRPSGLVESQGWDRLLPPLRKAGQVLGPVRPEIAVMTGLNTGTEILTGIHDSNASLLPYLKTDKDQFAVISTGTWAILMHVGGDIGCLDPTSDMLSNMDIFARPTPSARFMGGREYAAIAGEDRPPTLEIARTLLEAEIYALPAFSAQGGPWAGRPGQILGDLPEIPGARSSLASLYCALVCDDLLDRLGVAGTIYVDGPFAQNEVWLAALANLRAPAALIPSEGASPATGAARLALELKALPEYQPSPVDVLDIRSYRDRWRSLTKGSADQ